MDFTFTPEQEQFRREVRAFLGEALPAQWDMRDFTGDVPVGERAEVTREVRHSLVERRWLTLPWDTEHGGLGAGHVLQALFNEETAYARMPGGGGASVSVVGPALQEHGTAEQQQLWLPPIASGEDVWCLLYSEPDAGSDLSAIQTRAVRHGDEYVVNGVKSLIAGAHEATMGWLAARTLDRMPTTRGLAGVSIFAVPMDAPGVSVRPMPDIAGGDDLAEVRFDDVRVPARHLVGEEHEGAAMLAPSPRIERSGIEAYAAGRRHLEWLTEAVRGEPALVASAPGARHELADCWIELEAGQSLAYRVPLLQQAGQIPDAEVSMSRLHGAGLTQRIAATGMSVLGTAAQLMPGSPHARLGGAFSRLYLASTVATVAGGTTEVQRTTIARQGLGLPRD